MVVKILIITKADAMCNELEALMGPRNRTVISTSFANILLKAVDYNANKIMMIV